MKKDDKIVISSRRDLDILSQALDLAQSDKSAFRVYVEGLGKTTKVSVATKLLEKEKDFRDIQKELLRIIHEGKKLENDIIDEEIRKGLRYLRQTAFKAKLEAEQAEAELRKATANKQKEDLYKPPEKPKREPSRKSRIKAEAELQRLRMFENLKTVSLTSEEFAKVSRRIREEYKEDPDFADEVIDEIRYSLAKQLEEK